MDKIKVLKKFMGDDCDIAVSNYGTFEIGTQEYLVFTDKEADNECKERILEDLWAFRASYVIKYMKGYDKLSLQQEKVLTEAIEKMQEALCESANPIIEAIIQNMDSFIQDAIETDGRGHFLALYDHEENEEVIDGVTYFIYRQN